MEGIYSLENGGSVSVKLNTPTELSNIIIYPSSYSEYAPGSVDVVINDEFIIKGANFAGSLGNPLFISLTELPEGTVVSDLKFTLYTADGLEYAAISEIAIISAQNK